MSLDVLTAIWRAPPCKGGDLLCLLAIADNADDKGYAWPSVSTIAKKAAMGERGAQKCIRNLAENGLLIVNSGGGRNKTNAYQITTNGIGEEHKHINPEQNTPPPGSPFSKINPEQDDINPEPPFAKPRTPVHPNSQEPSKEPPIEAAAVSLGYSEYLEAHPRPVESAIGERHWDRLISEGVDPFEIVSSASAYARKARTFSNQSFVQQSDNFLDPERGKWRAHIPKVNAPLATRAESLQFFADWVNGETHLPSNAISSSLAGELVAANMVTPKQLKSRGISG